MRFWVKSLVLASTVLSLVGQSLAWNGTGHMVVADIAYRHLTPKAKAEADRLIKLSATEQTPDFITAACWADDTKTRENGPWHYIDLYFTPNGQPTALKSDEENAVWAIKKFSKVLADHSASDRDRAEALRYLVHIVGDLQMPLHCVSRVTPENPKGDAGGNRFYVEDPATVQGRRPHNLHYLWDDGCGLFKSEHRPLSPSGMNAINALADTSLAQVTASQIALARGVTDPMKWAEAGLALSKAVVYQTPENAPPSDDYIKKGEAVCERQVVFGGYRLADLLNRLLK